MAHTQLLSHSLMIEPYGPNYIPAAEPEWVRCWEFHTKGGGGHDWTLNSLLKYDYSHKFSRETWISPKWWVPIEQLTSFFFFFSLECSVNCGKTSLSSWKQHRKLINVLPKDTVACTNPGGTRYRQYRVNWQPRRRLVLLRKNYCKLTFKLK